MNNGSITGFSSARISSAMMEAAVAEQTRRLVKYASDYIRSIGDKIKTYNSRNHMDRTGTLLNSLCWGVTYGGRMVDSGFYRDAVTMPKGGNGGTESFLHEFFGDDMEYRDGRQLASEFLKSYKGRSKGWCVFFAILADYWGYWESGFTMKMGGSTVYRHRAGERSIPKSTRFMKFSVMSHVFDDVRMTLKPAETHFTVYVPKYAYKNPKWRKRRGVKRIGLQR